MVDFSQPPSVPHEAVNRFLGALREREFERAYRILASADRQSVPLADWLGPEWDSQEDEIFEQLEYFELDQTDATDSWAARVGVSFTFRNRLESRFDYRVVREAGSWHVYLGLDRAVGQPHRIPPYT